MKSILISVLLMLILCVQATNRTVIIEDFESGSIQLQSWLDEDIQPTAWTLTQSNTYNNSLYSLELSGNTWKQQMITPVILNDNTVISIAAKTSNGANVQGIGFSDGENALFYSLAGTLVLDIETWVPVYQGSQSNNTWNTFRFPIADDWVAFFDSLTTITSVIYINDLDGVGARSVWFDDVLDVTTDLPQAPQVTVSYSLIASNTRTVTAQFLSSVFDPDSAQWTYFWDFGDSTYSVEPSPIKTYNITDTHQYRVTLRVIDDSGKWGYGTILIDVDEGTSSMPLRINFVGDIMLARRYEQAGGIIPTQGVNAIFAPTLDVLGGAADITCANLEVALTNQGTPHPTKSVVYRGNPNNVTGLVYAGIDIVSLANNHTMDYMLPGMLQTQQVLSANNIIHSGSGANSYEAYTPAFINKRGLNIAFLRSSDRTGQYNNAQPFLQAGFDKPGFAYMTPYYITKQLADVEGIADLKIVEMHAGSEYSLSPGAGYDKSMPYEEDTSQDEDFGYLSDIPHQWDVQIRQTAIDAGADLVIVHHPHIIQALEMYNGKLIAHSIGNFVFDLDYPETMPSMILYADADHSGFSNFSVKPIYINDYIPIVPQGQLAVHILDYLAMRSRERNTLLKIDKNNLIGHVIADPDQVTPVTHSNSLQQYVYPISGDESQTSPFKLPRNGSISSVDLISPVSDAMLRLGQETVWYGNFENEGCTLWDIPAFNTTDMYDGQRCAILAPSNGQTTTATFKNKCRWYDNTRKFTLHGWIKTRNATNANIMIRYFSSRTQSYPISTESITDDINGTTDWTFYYKELTIPSNAWYYTIRLTVTNSTGQTVQALFDNVGLIEWTDWNDNYSIIPYPNNYSYMQIKTAEKPKSLAVNFTETDLWFTSQTQTRKKPASPISDFNSYPNPFNPEARISFDCKYASKVKLSVYNVKGQLVKNLIDSHLSPGKYYHTWNGKDSNNRNVSSGVYFFRIEADGKAIVKKTMLLK